MTDAFAEVRELSLPEINDCLDRGDFNGLIGVPEDTHVDFKLEPYHLVSPEAKYELQKDVSGLLNAGGGVIIMGIRTASSPLVSADVACALRSLPKSKVDEKQYLDVVHAGVFPKPSGIHLKFHEQADKPGHGFVSLHVPQQPKSSYPFLVSRHTETDSKTPVWLFGVPERAMSDVRFYEIQDLHRLIALGRTFDESLSGMQRDLANLVDAVSKSDGQVVSGGQSRNSSDIATRTTTLVEGLPESFATRSYLVLTATPQESVSIPTLTRSNGVRSVLESPPSLRHFGWNLTTLDHAKLSAGSSLVVTNGDRKAIRLDADGTLVAVAAFESFLCLGEAHPDGSPIVNNLALVEFSYEFVDFYNGLRRDFMMPKAHRIRFGVGLRNAKLVSKGLTLKLRAGDVRRLSFASDAVPPEQPTFDHVLDIETNRSSGTPSLDVGAISHSLVAAVFHNFGFTDDDVPYSTTDDPMRIDPNLILEVGR